jgi:hypothetical protein
VKTVTQLRMDRPRKSPDQWRREYVASLSKRLTSTKTGRLVERHPDDTRSQFKQLKSGTSPADHLKMAQTNKVRAMLIRRNFEYENSGRTRPEGKAELAPKNSHQSG